MASFQQQSEGSEHRGGLIGQIRALTESDQFDLANYTEPRIKDLLQSSFSTPLTNVKSMIRVQFIIGGGKLVRQKYDDEMIKWATAALREIGYTEDKSAAETLDSQGTYKHQHDTGQNLKYLIVYPRVTLAVEKSADDSAGDKKRLTAQEMIRICELGTFKDMVASKMVSWRQKKGCLKCIQDFQAEFAAIEAKLVSGQLLNAEEQDFYDTDKGNLTEKAAYLQGEIKSMVEGGRLTASEKAELIKTLDGNLQTFASERDAKVKESKPTKALDEKIAAVTAKKEAVSKLAPITHKLKYSDEIKELYMKIFPLQALEDKARGVSLTLKELQTVEGKKDFEQSIAGYEDASRGWFEEEDDFKSMCESLQKEAKAVYDKNKKPPKVLSGAGKAPGSSKAKAATSSANAWSVPSKTGGGSANKSRPTSSSASRFGAYASDSD